jgi:uncharacterized protein
LLYKSKDKNDSYLKICNLLAHLGDYFGRKNFTKLQKPSLNTNYRTMYQLSDIWIYPVKSLAGFRVPQASVTDRGLTHDRRWMLVDADDDFVSQRDHPELALFQTDIRGNSLVVFHKNNPQNILEVPLLTEGPTRPVTVWDDTVEAIEVSAQATRWFSEVVQSPTKLVYMPDTSLRKVDPKYAIDGDITSFSDGYPVLVIGQAALDHLNSQTEYPVEMRRFRPNLVFTGGQPHDEDRWQDLAIGTAQFWGVKPCARCVMTTVNPETAEVGKEPLRTLVNYRKAGNKILFGQNLLVGRTGHLQVGDAIHIKKWGEA